MKTNTFDIFILEPESKVTYINKTTGEFWNNWKKYKDCNDKEKLKINLASYPSNTILFDRDLKGYTEAQIQDDYDKFVRKMRSTWKIDKFYSYRSPNGYHIIAPFKNLGMYEEELRKELRKYYISLTSSDPAKISDRGVVSLPGRPHFKNNVTYEIFDHFEGENEFPPSVVDDCEATVKRNKEFSKKIVEDKDFSNYFEKDPFFLYLTANTIPDNTNRDMSIFPNLAVAAVRSGKSDEEIREIIGNLINENFPGKTYAEFDGWFKKAKSGEVGDYNPVQINMWMRDYSELKQEIYDLKGIDVKQSLDFVDVKSEEFKIYWDYELDSLENVDIKWLIDGWIPVGDICFIAGKAASYKSTVCLHWAYCIANDKLVFNEYKVIPQKVLYLNEENSNAILINIRNRVKKGLELTNGTDKVAFSLLNNIRFDNMEDINKLIKFINANEIKLLIFDSFRRFFIGEENDATLMNKLFNILKYIRNKTDTTILLIHHYKKQNMKGESDIRDRMRGSSDIMNSADSVIEVDRKHGQSAFSIQHSKLRAAEEITDKIIKIDTGDDEDMAYMYEIADREEKNKMLSRPEIIAEEIVKYLEDKKIENFKGTEIRKLFIDESHDTISKAFLILKKEGTITPIGLSKKLSLYQFNSLKKNDIPQDKE